MLGSYECAFFSELCYHGRASVESRLSGSLPDWRLLEISPLSDTGTKCLAFINEVLNKIVIAVRGSHVLENWITNFTALAPGLPPACYREIKIFTNRFREMEIFRGYDFTFTGHSLGAYLAELYVCEHGGDAVTFESPGCREIAETLGFDFSRARILTYLSSPNVVNTLYAHIGEIRRVYIHHTDIHGTGDDSEIDDLGGYAGALTSLATGKSFFASLSACFNLNYLKRMHSMMRILDCFDKHTGEPELYKKAFYWPSQSDYIGWISVDFSSISIKSFLSKRHIINQAIESRFSSIPNYVIGDCLVPNCLRELSDIDGQVYAGKALTRFDDFFWDLAKRSDFLLQLGYRGRSLNLPRHLGESNNMGKVKQAGISVGGAAGGAVVGAASVAGYGWYMGMAVKAAFALPAAPAVVAGAAVVGLVGGMGYCLKEANAENERLVARENDIRAQLEAANAVTAGARRALEEALAEARAERIRHEELITQMVARAPEARVAAGHLDVKREADAAYSNGKAALAFGDNRAAAGFFGNAKTQYRRLLRLETFNDVDDRLKAEKRVGNVSSTGGVDGKYSLATLRR